MMLTDFSTGSGGAISVPVGSFFVYIQDIGGQYKMGVTSNITGTGTKSIMVPNGVKYAVIAANVS